MSQERECLYVSNTAVVLLVMLKFLHLNQQEIQTRPQEMKSSFSLHLSPWFPYLSALLPVHSVLSPYTWERCNVCRRVYFRRSFLVLTGNREQWEVQRVFQGCLAPKVSVPRPQQHSTAGHQAFKAEPVSLSVAPFLHPQSIHSRSFIPSEGSVCLQ